MEPIQPGWKTSEFWLALIVALVSVLAPIATYYGLPEEEAQLWATAIVTLAGAVAAGFATGAYSNSRATVKSAQIKAKGLQNTQFKQ